VTSWSLCVPTMRGVAMAAVGRISRALRRAGATSKAAAKKAAPAKKAAAKKSPPAKKASPAKQAVAAKRVPAKKATATKKAAPAKKVTPVKKATPGRATAAKKAAPAKTAPAKKATAATKAPPAKKVPAGKSAPAKKVPVGKSPSVKKVTPAKASTPAAPPSPAKRTAPVKAVPAKQSPSAQAKAPDISVPKGSEWTKAELAAVRKDLETELSEMRRAYDLSLRDLDDLQKSSTDGAGDDQADAGSKTFEREQEQSIAANRLDLLTQIQRAVERIDAGTYGFCESCGRPIPKARLKAFPSATLDVACKQREERR
jgi:RNA polymerase-binding transcription factor DksA